MFWFVMTPPVFFHLLAYMGHFPYNENRRLHIFNLSPYLWHKQVSAKMFRSGGNFGAVNNSNEKNRIHFLLWIDWSQIDKQKCPKNADIISLCLIKYYPSLSPTSFRFKLLARVSCNINMTLSCIKCFSCN